MVMIDTTDGARSAPMPALREGREVSDASSEAMENAGENDKDVDAEGDNDDDNYDEFGNKLESTKGDKADPADDENMAKREFDLTK